MGDIILCCSRSKDEKPSWFEAKDGQKNPIECTHVNQFAWLIQNQDGEVGAVKGFT